MAFAFTRRRRLVLAWASAALAIDPAAAARQSLTLATGARPPLTSTPGQTGFLDALARDIFNRLEIDATVLRLPVERALINANAGVEDGDMFRAAGFEKDYPNLMRVPEKLLDIEFVAYASRADISVRDWSDLARYSVAYATGVKIFERNVKATRELVTVREQEQLFPLLAAGRVELVLLDRLQAGWLAREAGVSARALEPPLARTEMFIYLHKRHAALVGPLSAALAAAKRDGTWQRLYDQAFKPPQAPR